MQQLIRVIELYFSQLDSQTPNQAASYKAHNFYGGVFSGDVEGGTVTADTVVAQLLTALQAQIREAAVDILYSNYAELKAILNERMVSKDVMANNFYGGLFSGDGYGAKLPHVCASDSTDQLADGDDTETQVKWDTLESGYGWTLNSPGSATAGIAGVYKITYSLQFINTANDSHYVTVWLKVNTNDVANSSTTFFIPGRKSATEFAFICAYSEATFVVDVGDEFELYWATNLAGDPTVPTDGVYMFHDVAQTTPYARPAIPSAIGSITFVSALNTTKVAPLPVLGLGQLGTINVLTNLG
jgi:hypothetical protein